MVNKTELSMISKIPFQTKFSYEIVNVHVCCLKLIFEAHLSFKHELFRVGDSCRILSVLNCCKSADVTLQ